MTNLVTLFEDSDLSGLPAANPGNGKPWIDPTSHAIIVGALGTFGVSQAYVDTGLSNKADLVAGKVPASQLPSYVDDVLEFANLAAFPGTGETGKIYVALNTNRTYRWSGSAYVELTDSTAVWGAISGTLSNQTDLQNALNSKANAATTLAGYGITNALALSGGTLTGTLGVNGASVGTGSFAVAGPTGRRVDYDVNGNLVVTAPEGTAGTVRLGSAYTRKGVYSDTDLTLTSEGAFAFWISNSVRALQIDSTIADFGNLTGAASLPSGTTAQRPASPTAGMMRYNSTDGRHEFRTASAWVNHVRLSGDTMTGDLTFANQSKINFPGTTTYVGCPTFQELTLRAGTGPGASIVLNTAGVGAISISPHNGVINFTGRLDGPRAVLKSATTSTPSLVLDNSGATNDWHAIRFQTAGSIVADVVAWGRNLFLVPDVQNNDQTGVLFAFSGSNGVATQIYGAKTKSVGTVQPIIFGNASGLTTIRGSSIVLETALYLGTFTVASLPPAASSNGASAQVTDSTLAMTAANYGSTVAGGGSNRARVFCQNSTWIIA